MDCSPSGSSVHRILQARILEWVAVPFSRGSSQPRDHNPGLLHCRQIPHCLSHQGSPREAGVGNFYFCKYLFPNIRIKDSASEHICATWPWTVTPTSGPRRTDYPHSPESAQLLSYIMRPWTKSQEVLRPVVKAPVSWLKLVASWHFHGLQWRLYCPERPTIEAGRSTPISSVGSATYARRPQRGPAGHSPHQDSTVTLLSDRPFTENPFTWTNQVNMHLRIKK